MNLMYEEAKYDIDAILHVSSMHQFHSSCLDV